MKNTLFLTLVLSAFLEGTILPFPLTVIIVAILVMSEVVRGSLYVFIGGILLDLLSFSFIGSHSLFFLLLAFLISRYKTKIHLSRFSYRVGFTVFLTILYSLVFYKYFSVGVLVFSLIVSPLLFYVFDRYIPTGTSKERLYF